MAYEKQEVEEQEQEKAQAAAMTSLRERQVSPSQGSIDLFASQVKNYFFKSFKFLNFHYLYFFEKNRMTTILTWNLRPPILC